MIVAEHLGKTFTTTVTEPGLAGTLRSLVRPQRRTKVAVDDVSFTAAAGELLVLLGPNGAGKSTLIKMLTGIVRPTAGAARVAGRDPRQERRATAREIGVVFGQRTQLWWDLPIRDSLRILQSIYEISEDAFTRRLAVFEEILALSEFADQRLREVSLGQRVRADLAGALLHEPSVVFLDEPTIGMDVVAKAQVREFLRTEIAQRGCTVLLTTHDVNEVRRLAERVLVIQHGRLVVDGDVETLLRRFGGSWRLAVTLDTPVSATPPAGLVVLEQDGPVVRLGPDPVRPGLDVQTALRLVVADWPVAGIAIEEDDLEDVLRLVFTDAR